MELKTPIGEERTRANGLLGTCGILTELRAACATLLNSDPEVIRSMMISTSVVRDGDVDDAIRLFAEEQCVVPKIERRGGSLVIHLTRRDVSSPSMGR